MEPFLTTDKLAVGYGQPLLSHINVSVQKGELICLLGVNGSGKSTLLRTIGNLMEPLSGDVYVQQKQLKQFSSKELSKLVSIASTDRSGISDLSIYEYVSLGRSPYTNMFDRLSNKDEHIVNGALTSVKCEEYRDRKLYTLSDGERQRVLIARLLAQQTPLMLLDEPTSFLDLPNKIILFQLLKHLSSEQHKGIVISTHDLELALRLSDKLWLVDQNRILEGTPHELIKQGLVNKIFDTEKVCFNKETKTFEIKD